MAFLPASRTKRNLFKIASLGLAGLIAGLLSGCTDSPETSSATTPYTHLSTDSLSATSADSQSSRLPDSLDDERVGPLTAREIGWASH